MVLYSNNTPCYATMIKEQLVECLHDIQQYMCVQKINFVLILVLVHENITG
jgi:hypothetical protein